MASNQSVNNIGTGLIAAGAISSATGIGAVLGVPAAGLGALLKVPAVSNALGALLPKKKAKKKKTQFTALQPTEPSKNSLQNALPSNNQALQKTPVTLTSFLIPGLSIAATYLLRR
jgi:hypothetical protein